MDDGYQTDVSLKKKEEKKTVQFEVQTQNELHWLIDVAFLQFKINIHVLKQMVILFSWPDC